MQKKSGNLSGDTVRSFAIHGVLIAAIMAVGTGIAVDQIRRTPATGEALAAADGTLQNLEPQNTPGDEAADASMPPSDESSDDLTDQPAAPPPPEAAFSTSLVEAHLAEALDGQLSPEEEAALREATQQWLQEQAAGLELSDMSAEELATLTDQLRQKGLQQMAEQVQDLGRTALLEEARKLLDGAIHEQLTSRIEAELQGRLGEQLKRRLMEELQNDRKARFEDAVQTVDTLRKELEQAKRKLEGARNNAQQERYEGAENARAEVESTVAEQLEQGTAAIEKLTETVPQAADAIRTTTAALDAAGLAQELDEAQAALGEKNKDASVARLEEARTALQTRSDELQRLRDALNKARGDREPDPLSQEMMEAMLPRLREMLAEQLAQQSSEEAAAQVATKLNEALKVPAERLGLDGEELQQAVTQMTQERLAANLREHGPEIDSAFSSVRSEMRLRTAEELTQAKAEAVSAREKLEVLRDAQAAVQIAEDRPQEEIVAAQQKVGEQFEAVAEHLQEASDAARAASPRTRDQLNALDRQMVHAESTTRLAALPQEIEAHDFTVANRTKDQLVAGWTAGINTLREVEKTLDEERKQVEAMADRPEVAVDEERLAAVGDAMAQDVQAVAGEVLPEAFRVAGNVDLRGSAQHMELALSNVTGMFDMLNQRATNLANGRAVGGLDPMALGMGNLAGHGGRGLFDPRVATYNAAAMELYGKEIRDRASPEAYYEEVTESTGVATIAAPIDPDMLPATVYFDPAPPAEEATAADATDERKVPEPTFKTLAFAAAAMMEKPVTIDGDLSDWGELRHPIPTRFEDDGKPVQDPTDVYIRWSPEGLYVAYTTKKTGAINPNQSNGWQGDCLELWLDMDNTRRKQMRDSDTAHQFFLMPFGYRANPADTLGEYGRGQRSTTGASTYVLGPEYGQAAAKVEPGVGYTVEGFIGRRALSKPNLFPGAYLAMNYSLNRGWGSADWEQWASPKAHSTHDKPDTWGDLLLLGSDGHAGFITAMDDDEPAASVVPGGIIAVQVRDKDMDLNPRRKDLVPATLTPSGHGSSLLIILEETEPDSGIFRASVNTQPYVAPSRENTLNVRGGDEVTLTYTDARAEYGEPNRVVTETLKVATPVHHLASQ